MSTNPRIYLSPPHMTGGEIDFIRDALESNWVAPLGPHVEAFERELAESIGVPNALALLSGTAALHLSMRLIGIKPGDEVIVPALSFCATANAVLYEGGSPVFIDSERSSWNLDPNLLEEELADRSKRGDRLPKAVIAVDLYGQCADYARINEICGRYALPLIEDAAEALGASYNGLAAGSFGKMAVFSFNGNKIITTSGGGMLVSNDPSLIEKARHFATQARDDAPYYQHSSLGYNYRLSNVLAAIGRAQLLALPERVAARRNNFATYHEALSHIPGIEFMPEAPYGQSTRWLTCIVIDREKFGASPDDIRLALEAENIEARPIWKPLHLQPLFAGSATRGGAVVEGLFENGLCLPSGSALTSSDLSRVIENILKARR